MAEFFPHPRGLLFLDLFWHQQGEAAIHVVAGAYKGEGPWKVGACVISVLARVLHQSATGNPQAAETVF